MKQINAKWEIANIGSKTLEIEIEEKDSISDQDIDELCDSFEYVVVKVPTNKTDFNWFLSSLGFTMLETQIKLSKKIKDFNFEDRYIKRFLPDVRYEIIQKHQDLDMILNRITPDMFLTDRITLDPVYGAEIGCRRYKNWINSSFSSNSDEIIGIYFKDCLVGFEMHSIKGEVCEGKLGGVFSDVKIPGLGFLTACAPLLFTAEKYGVKEFVPDISSNNIPVLSLYDYFNFKIKSLSYVFVKHNIK